MPPQDVKKKNQLSITNQLPDYAIPVQHPDLPDYAIPFNADQQEQQNQEEAQARSEQPPLRRAFEWVNKPIVNLMSPQMQEVTKQFSQPGLNDTENEAYWKGMLGGGMQGLSDFISFQSSPLGLGLEGLTAGASGAKNAAEAAIKAGDAVNAARYGKLAATLQRPGQIGGAGMVGHGLYNAATDPDPMHKLSALSEAAMGGAGMAHLMQGTPAANVDLLTRKPVPFVPAEPGPSSPWIRPDRSLGPAKSIQLGAGEGPYPGPTTEDLIRNINKQIESAKKGPLTNEEIINSINDQIRRSKTPMSREDISLPAEFSTEGEATAKSVSSRGKSLTDAAYNRIRQKLGMGLDLPQGPKINVTKIPKEFEGLKVSEPEVEAAKTQKKIPYFIQNAEGKWVANPEHPELKGQLPERERAKGGKGLKIGSNIEGSARELTTGYSKPIEQIMVREGMQNAIDAVKHLGKDGRIHVNVEDTGRSITISDNGKGMSRQELQTVMSDLNRSGKANDPNATGGKGVGKATYLLGGAHFELTTVKQMRGQKLMFSFKGTPEEIFKGTEIRYHVVPDITPTGTTFTTKLAPGQNPILARVMAKEVIEHSRDLEAKVTTNFASMKDPRDFKQFNKDNVVADENFKGNGIKVAIPEDSKLKTRSFVKLKVLNNGMFQYEQYFNLGKDVIGMPEDVIVNITPFAKEGTNEYPFPTQRESLKTEINNKVLKLVQESLIDPQESRHKTKLVELYGAMTEIGSKVKNFLNRPSVMYDPGERMTPEEKKYFENSDTVNSMARFFDHTIDDILESIGNSNWKDRLEKTGLVLDPESHAIHIPNPSTGQSMIGFNPFLRIEEMSPDSAALSTVATSLHEVGHIGLEKGINAKSFSDWYNHPRLGEYLDNYFEHQRVHGNVNQGHAIGWLTRLGDVYAAYGPEKFFNAVEKFQNIIQDPRTGGYTSEVQKLLSIYQESRGRDETTEDFLSRTGERAKSTGGREGNIRGNDKSNASGPIRREPKPEIVDKLIEALKAAGAKRATQEEMYSVERATRIGAANKADTGGLVGFYKQLRELKGEMPKVDFERTQLSGSDVNDLINAVGSSPYLLGYEKIRAKMGLLKMLSAKREEVPQFNELRLLKQVFGPKFDEVTKMHGGLGGSVGGQAVKDVANLPKAIMASIDMSAPLRQGLPLIHKEAWRNNIVPMVKMFGSQKIFDATMQGIKDRPNYLLGKEAGLKLTEMGHDPTMTEEAYGSNIANAIPGVKASERAYVGFLNKLRADTFDSLIKDAKDAGLPAKDVMHEIADFVNTASGRGQLPGKMDRVAHELNNVFFSPRLMASRVAMMNPATYINASPFVRKEFLKAAFATASAGLTTSALMSAMGAKTATKLSDDKGTPLFGGKEGFDPFTMKPTKIHGIAGMPISADFGKSQFGNTREENYGGFLPYVTYMGRMLSGERESSTTGKSYILGKGFATPTRLNITEDFMANKLSPAASLVYKILKQKDPTGKEYQFSPQMMQSLIDISKGNFDTAMKNAKTGEVGDMFIPMFIGDVIAIMKDDPEHLPLAAGSFFGMGTQTYGKTPPKVRSTGLGINIGAGMRP